MQETPETISVYGTSSRTTSSLEAYNGNLNKIIQAKGAFFKFVAAIRDEEYLKQRELHMLIDSGGVSSSQNQKRTTKDRHARITEAIELFVKNELTLVLLMNRLTCPSNKNVNKMDNFVDDGEVASSESENENEYETVATNNITATPYTPICVVCRDARPNRFQMECGHVRLCGNCYDQLEAQAVADNTRPKCPECRAEIHETRPAFV